MPSVGNLYSPRALYQIISPHGPLHFSALSDRHLQLFHQERPPAKLTIFTYFSYLPTELRLKIWRLALPETGHHRSLDGLLRQQGAYLYERRPPLFEWPIGLHTNRESCYETLSRYFVGELTENGVCAIERFCMDPARGIAYLEIFTLNGPKNYGRTKLLELFTLNKDFAASIQTLEIRRVYFPDTFDEWFVKLIGRALGELLTRLQEVRLVSDKQKYHWNRAVVRANLDNCVRDLEALFKVLKEENPGRSLPMVKALDWYEVS